MLPLHDDNPTRRFAIVTTLIIAINVAVFAWQATRPNPDAYRSVAEFEASQEAVLCRFGVLPERVTGDDGALNPADLCVVENEKTPRPVTLVTHQFVHGGLLHLLGNMLFLLIFGNNVEDRLGRARFTVFYLLCGLIAALGQVLLDPGSGALMVGASGAISGVLGAYLLMFPRARVLALIAIVPVRLPAWVVLGAYLAFQILYVSRASGTEGGGGVAYWAHIIGFAAGVGLTLLLTGGRPAPPAPGRSAVTR